MLVKYGIDFQDGLEGWLSVELVYSGCRRAVSGNPCPGCHNDWLWDFGGKYVCRRKFVEWLEGLKNADWTPSGIILMGGEPLDQDTEEVLFDVSLVDRVFGKKFPAVVYTGYNWEEKLLSHPTVIGLVGTSDANRILYLKVGEYKRNLRGSGKFASTNQRLVKVSSDAAL